MKHIEITKEPIHGLPLRNLPNTADPLMRSYKIPRTAAKSTDKRPKTKRVINLLGSKTNRSKNHKKSLKWSPRNLNKQTSRCCA